MSNLPNYDVGSFNLIEPCQYHTSYDPSNFFFFLVLLMEIFFHIYLILPLTSINQLLCVMPKFAESL
ncbi:hypothetical protein NC652_029913 [Populus alba x Populus x berolinensis]|uniref:Uncharacterized protein n=1 Tax=Populus alba x Populus x berolinensis TaxID=444605 RepID=A0AAD6M2J5_9ROSI|nr:hypothetical protein NC652_029907 [Populus alba x Populus x berolinensis]KAJ6888963.1 hypothetical protein NC652_029913 [Populus alba x Populus x berolinensis]KAJ6977749.1 hypothetical protein NC653_029593 [Populus alba x Populus x berolinensis]KAJ6977756.1 hypothetical protein NC653_029598 [Populus alba x Populus x berolinensis]KAJ6977786.1 hypothetical protein NC653_029627 [Populus alba x Populus x berolinensis]